MLIKMWWKSQACLKRMTWKYSMKFSTEFEPQTEYIHKEDKHVVFKVNYKISQSSLKGFNTVQRLGFDLVHD